ncbi:hypothetical protein LTR62_001648 [Meristemomyces frigidus]|uniref:GRIP domain-containing protein n=1 Tax=Meristemomyces frigidus TaxID=1508187 RepID=A0AAN7TJM9_9PEZI|nr:hypothetical protein LTR62_001648 [Meristemomyces frigidus]
MFNRLKNLNLDSFLDTKIAEEQARQAKQPQPPRRSGSNARPRRSSQRTDSPARRGGSRLRVADGGDGSVAGKTPDPEDFVIGDDASDISRVPTPRPIEEGTTEGLVVEDGKRDSTKDAPLATAKGKGKMQEIDELPEEVRKKLAKLEQLTGRYQELLRNYRTAHARVTAIEPFEATLREHTPLTSIQDPSALAEFLNQRTLQSQMVLDELKSVTGERDQLKLKLSEAEQKARKAFDEAAGLREQRQTTAQESKADSSTGDPLGVLRPSSESDSTKKPEEDDFFSYDTEQKRSLEDEIRNYQAEIQEHKDYVNELSTENATLRKDLDMCQLNLNAMENKVGVKGRDVDGVKQQLDEAKDQIAAAGKAREVAQAQEQEAAAVLAQTEGQVELLQSRLKGYQQSLNEREQELKEKAALAEENLQKYQDEHAENLKKGIYAQRDNKGLETLRGLVTQLRKQLEKAEAAKKEVEGHSADLKHELKVLESEATARGNLVVSLRENQTAVASYKEKLALAEQERDAAKSLAESKRGHEAQVASMRSQMRRAIEARDEAYNMIMSCTQCGPLDKKDEKGPEPVDRDGTPELRSRVGSESTGGTEASTMPSTPGTPSVDGEPEVGEAKAKTGSKKKKSKSKKKTAVDALAVAASASSASTPTTVSKDTMPTIEELIADPEKAKELLRKDGVNETLMNLFIERSIADIRSKSETENDGREGVIAHLESRVEVEQQKVREQVQIVQQKDQEIEALRLAIAGKEDAIDRLDRKLKGEEELKEEISTLRDEVLELGGQATDAKHELKIVREQKVALQHEFEEMQVECDDFRKTSKDLEAQRDDLARRCKTLETEIVGLNDAQTSSSSASGDELQAALEELKGLEKEKDALQTEKQVADKKIEELESQHTKGATERDAKHSSLSAEIEQLEGKAAGLESDLAAANELAQTRFKDLTDLREHTSKLQPELKRLREEVSDLHGVKADLEKSNAALKRLENKEKDLRSEIALYKAQSVAKDGEIIALKEQAKQSNERSKALEESYEGARQDLEHSQTRRDEATETRDKLQADLQKAEAQLQRSRTGLDDLEKQLKKFQDEAASLRDELHIKSAQHASAQSLMSNQQDQSRELAVQMREIRARNESLEEELTDAQRLLQERSREGETMRRMLSEVEVQAESRVKDMRERIDLAFEERDRAEDEVGAVGRKKARELEELRTKLRDAEREAARATEAKEDAERRERGFLARQSEIEDRAKQAQEELAEVRTAMAQLGSSLDESERQTGILDREKTELKKELDERQLRFEKLQKSGIAMSEEVRNLQQTNKLRQQSSSMQSSRSSLESNRVMSPAAGPRGSSNGALGGKKEESIDFVYLKNVLFQFLEQREKKHQLQLVPVLGMLLHFDRQDQQKWEAAIAAR